MNHRTSQGTLIRAPRMLRRLLALVIALLLAPRAGEIVQLSTAAGAMGAMLSRPSSTWSLTPNQLAAKACVPCSTKVPLPGPTVREPAEGESVPAACFRGQQVHGSRVRHREAAKAWHPPLSQSFTVSGAWGLGTPGPSDAKAAEVAHLADGRRITGTLTLGKNGQVRFDVPGQVEPVAIDRIDRVRFPETTLAPFRVGGNLRVLLRDGQSLTGPLVRLDRDLLVLRTAWAARVNVPRAAVAALTQLPGWQPVFEDNFASRRKEWTGKARPALEVEQGACVAVLNEAGQELVYTLAEPIRKGRVGVNFQERDGASGARWLLEMTFRQDQELRTLTVTLAGDGEGYPVAAPGLEGKVTALARTPGWHRVTVQFSGGSLRVLLDESALWYNLERGPGGALQQVRLRCQGSGQRKGALALTEFSVAQGVDEAVRPIQDPSQDEVWLATGDQLFGVIVGAADRTVTLEGRFGRRSLPWTAVRGCYLREAMNRPPALEGTPVRVWLGNGVTAEPDVIEGVIVGLDEPRWRLRNAWLGELKVERERVRQVRWRRNVQE